MLTIKQKAVATVVVIVLNATVLALMGWYVLLTAIPSLLFLAAILRR